MTGRRRVLAGLAGAGLGRLLPLALGTLLPRPARAQGFAGLGTGAEGFALPDPAYRMRFPADHGAHPEFRVEWWYLTAILQDADGQPLGLQWTLFRTALAPGEGEGWRSPQLWMGNAAVTTASAHHVAERLARGGVGQAGVTAVPFAAWIDDWQMAAGEVEAEEAAGTDPGQGAGPGIDDLRLTARGADFAYDVALHAEGPVVLQGAQGFSVKAAGGQASHYYSQPFFRVAGTVTLPDGPRAVTGEGWLDREWSSQPLAADQTGWDWFSLSFDTGDKLMAFRLRGARDFTAATWIGADGQAQAYPDGALVAQPMDTARVAGRDIPVRWRVRLAARGLDVEVGALNPGAWMAVSLPYWEGPVAVTGSHAGRGYLEMTGY